MSEIKVKMQYIQFYSIKKIILPDNMEIIAVVGKNLSMQFN